MMEENTRKYVEELKELRDDWSNEIPAEIVHSPVKYKVRKGWFWVVGCALTDGVEKGYINERDYETFLENLGGNEFMKRHTTEEDIKKSE